MNLSYSKLHNTCLQCKTSKLPMVPMEQTDSWETQWATHSSTNPYQCQTTSSNTTPIPQIRKKSEHRPLLWPQCGTWSQHWKMLQGSCGFPHKVKRQNSGRSKVNNTWHRPNEASTSQTTSQATPQWTPHLLLLQIMLPTTRGSPPMIQSSVPHQCKNQVNCHTTVFSPNYNSGF